MNEIERGHSHDHNCGHNHGSFKRSMEAIEHKFVSRIGNERAKALTAAALRGMSLLFCPGDDLAAIGLQLYASVSGHADTEHDHHAEHQAILSRRPRIAFETSTRRGRKYITAELPVDTPLYHDDISDSPIGQEVKSFINDIGRIQRAEITQLRKEKAARKAEKTKQSFFRKLAIGAAALSLFGVFGTETHKTAPRITEVTTSSPEPSKKLVESQPRPTGVFEEVMAKPGDSQWRIVEKRVEDIVGEKNNAITNVATKYASYLNRNEIPYPHAIEVGDQLRIPSRRVIERIEAAIETPVAVEPEFAEAITRLNEEAVFYSEESRTVLQRFDQFLQ